MNERRINKVPVISLHLAISSLSHISPLMISGMLKADSIVDKKKDIIYHISYSISNMPNLLAISGNQSQWALSLGLSWINLINQMDMLSLVDPIESILSILSIHLYLVRIDCQIGTKGRKEGRQEGLPCVNCNCTHSRLFYNLQQIDSLLHALQ